MRWRLAAVSLLAFAGCRAIPARPAPPVVAPEPPASFTVWQKLDWLEERLRSLGPEEMGLRASLLVRSSELYLAADRSEKAGGTAREAIYAATPSSSGRPAGDRSLVESRARTVLGVTALDRGDTASARRELETALRTARDEVDSSAARAFLVDVANREGKADESRSHSAQVRLPDHPRIAELRAGLRTPIRPSLGAATASAKGGGVTVVPRGQWRPAAIGKETDPIGKITCVTIHHEAREFYGKTLGDSLDQIRNIQSFHQRSRGYADIGYHFLVDRLGNVIEGRPLTLQGAHAGQKNRLGAIPNLGNVGISLLGNYEVQQPTPAQVRALRELVAWLQALYDIPNARIYTHQQIKNLFDISGTACPGCNLKGIVEDIQRNGALPVPR